MTKKAHNKPFDSHNREFISTPFVMIINYCKSLVKHYDKLVGWNLGHGRLARLQDAQVDSVKYTVSMYLQCVYQTKLKKSE